MRLDSVDELKHGLADPVGLIESVAATSIPLVRKSLVVALRKLEDKHAVLGSIGLRFNGALLHAVDTHIELKAALDSHEDVSTDAVAFFLHSKRWSLRTHYEQSDESLARERFMDRRG